MAGVIRDLNKIKSNITTNKGISRQDVYEILQNVIGKDASEKKEGVSAFLQTLPTETIKEKDIQGKTTLEKILVDLGSYPI